MVARFLRNSLATPSNFSNSFMRSMEARANSFFARSARASDHFFFSLRYSRQITSPSAMQNKAKQACRE